MAGFWHILPHLSFLLPFSSPLSCPLFIFPPFLPSYFLFSTSPLFPPLFHFFPPFLSSHLSFLPPFLPISVLFPCSGVSQSKIRDTSRIHSESGTQLKTTESPTQDENMCHILLIRIFILPHLIGKLHLLMCWLTSWRPGRTVNPIWISSLTFSKLHNTWRMHLIWRTRKISMKRSKNSDVCADFEWHLSQELLERILSNGRSLCHFCYQTRGELAPMLSCKTCSVVWYAFQLLANFNKCVWCSSFLTQENVRFSICYIYIYFAFSWAATAARNTKSSTHHACCEKVYTSVATLRLYASMIIPCNAAATPIALPNLWWK